MEEWTLNSYIDEKSDEFGGSNTLESEIKRLFNTDEGYGSEHISPPSMKDIKSFNNDTFEEETWKLS